MEADWSVEIGEDLPRIVVPWAADGYSYIDLRSHPEAAATLSETQAYPALRWALMDLNSPSSLVFTSKCDVWGVPPDDLDWLEMETTADNTKAGLACYIDLVRREGGAFASFLEQETWLRRTTTGLRATPSPCSRAELVLREVAVTGFDGESHDGFGVTLYITGCGRNVNAAQRNWGTALAGVVPVLVGAA